MLYGILFFVSLIIAVVLIVFLNRVKNVLMAKYLIVLTTLVSFWILMETTGFFIKINELTIFFQKSKYIGVILVPPLFLLSAIEFVKKDKSKYFDSRLLFIVPGLSLISLVSESFPYKFISNAQIIYQKSIPLFIYKKEIGFWVHTIYCYSVIILACYLLLLRALKSPKLYRKQSIFIFAGTTLSFIINIMFISNIFGVNFIDTTSISILVTLIVFYWGIFHMPQTGIVPIARDLVIEGIKDLVVILDTSDCIIDTNPAAMEYIELYCKKNRGIDLGKGMNLRGIKLSEVLDILPDIRTIRSIGDTNKESMITFTSDDKTFYFRVYESLIYDTDKAVIGKLFMLHDITLMQEYLNSLEFLNEELIISDRIINDTLEGILITDALGNITRVNSSFERISGYTEEEVIGKNPRIFKSNRHDANFYAEMWHDLINKGYWEGEIWDRKKSGEIYPKWMSVTSIKQTNGTLTNYISISSDISKIKKTEDALQNLAYYDSLTGIPNRTLFYERLERSLIRAKRNNKAVALLFMDLDEFKVINDTLGHAAGDLILKEVAGRIKSCIRESDTVSRLGGDEFTIILDDIYNHEDVKTLAEAVMMEISKPFSIIEREVIISVSIGIALAPYDETTVEGLVRKADAAMYHAKENGRSRYSFSSEEIEKRNHEILEMQIRLRKALADNEFKLYLQPQIAFNGERFKIVGAEALIRWKTKDGAIITPDKFIPISENNGMIISIGNWVVEEIFRIDNVLKENGINIKLGINVSAKQFENGNFVSKLKGIYEENKSQKINLVIEITESLLMQNIKKAIESLLEIKAAGIGIALDDFGTGFSSLSYLTRLPIDYLKIDKSFIDNFGNQENKNLTSAIISMAKTLNIKTVAEGVETLDQAKRLIKEACDELQGYYFSRPLEINEFIKYVIDSNLK